MKLTAISCILWLGANGLPATRKTGGWDIQHLPSYTCAIHQGTNEYRRLFAQERSTPAVKPLIIHGGLTQVAQTRCETLASTGIFEHDMNQIKSECESTGWCKYRGAHVGENLAMSTRSWQDMTRMQVMINFFENGWLNDDTPNHVQYGNGHRRAMENEKWMSTGIAVCSAMTYYKKWPKPSRMYYGVQIFSSEIPEHEYPLCQEPIELYGIQVLQDKVYYAPGKVELLPPKIQREAIQKHEAEKSVRKAQEEKRAEALKTLKRDQEMVEDERQTRSAEREASFGASTKVWDKNVPALRPQAQRVKSDQLRSPNIKLRSSKDRIDNDGRPDYVPIKPKSHQMITSKEKKRSARLQERQNGWQSDDPRSTQNRDHTKSDKDRKRKHRKQKLLAKIGRIVDKTMGSALSNEEIVNRIGRRNRDIPLETMKKLVEIMEDAGLEVRDPDHHVPRRPAKR